MQLVSLFPQLHTLPQLWRDSARPITATSATNYMKYVSHVVALPEVAAHFATSRARQQQQAGMRRLEEAVQAYKAAATTAVDAAPKQQRLARPAVPPSRATAALQAPTVVAAATAAAPRPPPPLPAAASGAAASMLTAQQMLLHTFRTQLQLGVETLLRWKSAAKLLQTLPDDDPRVRFFWLQHEVRAPSAAGGSGGAKGWRAEGKGTVWHFRVPTPRTTRQTTPAPRRLCNTHTPSVVCRLPRSLCWR